jgi:hypothetical protein
MNDASNKFIEYVKVYYMQTGRVRSEEKVIERG